MLLVSVRCGSVIADRRSGWAGVGRVAIRVTKNLHQAKYHLRDVRRLMVLTKMMEAQWSFAWNCDRAWWLSPADADHPATVPTQQAPAAPKADRHSLKATIAELITATEIAERAIEG